MPPQHPYVAGAYIPYAYAHQRNNLINGMRAMTC